MFNSISEGKREGGGGRIYKSIFNVIYKKYTRQCVIECEYMMFINFLYMNFNKEIRRT
jgi:hypothetical protein